LFTLFDAAQNARKAFYAASIETPDLDARVLLSCAMGTDINKLFANMSCEMPPRAAELFAAFVERRIAGECAAYITGRKWFRYLELEVNNSVLVPRPETEMLINACLELVNSKLTSRNSTVKVVNILDLCTGSGAVGLSLKFENHMTSLTLSDISPAALAVAKRNAERLKLDVNIVESDLFQNIQGEYDIIVSNPPYVPTAEIETLSREVQNEPRLALDGGEDGLDLIRKIIPEAKKHLAPGGGLFLEADPRQAKEIGRLLAEESSDASADESAGSSGGQRRFEHCWFSKDYAGNERIAQAVLAR
jgi:release factor glutamine methyltransferase